MIPSRRWAVPDGWMPSGAVNGIDGHEAICVMNLGDAAATIDLTVLFEDRDAVRVAGLACGPQRTRHFRLDRPEELGGAEVPFETPYALLLASDVPVVVQHTRVDVRGGGLSLMTTMGAALDEDPS